NDLRASSITAGQVVVARANGSITSSEFDVAGPILSLTAGQNITSTAVNSTGPDGRLDLLQSQFFLTGSVSVSGPIGTVQSVQGDVIASISTQGSRGTINLLQAGGNLLVTLDAAADVSRIIAARNIGDINDAHGSRALTIKGNLDTIEA